MKKIDLTKGNVLKVIMMLALPIIGSSLLQFTYNFIDMVFVGKLGSGAVASVGTSSFLLGVGYAINALVITGTGITVSHAIGRRDDEDVKGYINAGFRINFYLAVFYVILLLLIGKPFIKFLNLGNGDVAQNAYHYLIVSAPIMFITFYNLLYTRILSSFGNNEVAFKINAVGLGINIVLDPLFIYGFKQGVVGAAYATLIGNVVVLLLLFYKSKSFFKVNFKGKIEKEKAQAIFKLGFPMATQRILFTLINIVLAKIIALFGADAIAAQKIGLQVESISLMILGGFNGAIASFTGQNYGAKQFKRIREGYRITLIVGSVYAGILGMLFVLSPGPLVRIFVSETNTVIIASHYLGYIGITTVFAAIEVISNGLFTGIGLPKIPATISILFTLLRIPLALIFIKPFGINGIWLSIALTSALKGTTSFICYKSKVRLESID